MKKTIVKPLVEIEEVSGLFKLNPLFNKILARFIIKIFQLHKINSLYLRHADKQDVDFLRSVIDELGINYLFSNNGLASIPFSGAFVIVANHPLGVTESLILLENIISIRPDIKVLGNFVLTRIEPVKKYILPVNPFDAGKGKNTSLTGLKNTITHLKNGGGLLVFPAGKIASYRFGKGISEWPWNKPVLRLIKNQEVPVLPLYIEAKNSVLFYILGAIHPRLRTLLIPSQLLNKRKKLIRFSFRSLISVREQSKYPKDENFTNFLVERTFGRNIHDSKKHRLFGFANPYKAPKTLEEKDILLFGFRNNSH